MKSLLCKPFLYKRCAFTFKLLHLRCQPDDDNIKKSKIEKCAFPLESIRVQWIRWTPSERLSTPSSNMSGIFLSLSRIENELSNGSDGLQWNDFPPPHPTRVRFFLSLTNRKMCFSIGIYSCPMHAIHFVGFYTTRLPVFRWKTRGYDWILVDSIGQPSQFYRQKVFKCY